MLLSFVASAYAFRSVHMFLGLKGRNPLAQPTGLGTGVESIASLKGRNKELRQATLFLSPLLRPVRADRD